MKLFVSNYILRRSCSDCHYKGYSRVADITLGDFWGIWNIIPDMDDNKGTSLVLTHSDKGEKLLKTAADNLRYGQVTLDQATMMNASLIKSSFSQPSRDKVLDEIAQNGFDAKETILGIINQEEIQTTSLPSGLAFIKKLIKKLSR